MLEVSAEGFKEGRRKEETLFLLSISHFLQLFSPSLLHFIRPSLSLPKPHPTPVQSLPAVTAAVDYGEGRRRAFSEARKRREGRGDAKNFFLAFQLYVNLGKGGGEGRAC